MCKVCTQHTAYHSDTTRKTGGFFLERWREGTRSSRSRGRVVQGREEDVARSKWCELCVRRGWASMQRCMQYAHTLVHLHTGQAPRTQQICAVLIRSCVRHVHTHTAPTAHARFSPPATSSTAVGVCVDGGHARASLVWNDMHQDTLRTCTHTLTHTCVEGWDFPFETVSLTGSDIPAFYRAHTHRRAHSSSRGPHQTHNRPPTTVAELARPRPLAINSSADFLGLIIFSQG